MDQFSSLRGDDKFSRINLVEKLRSWRKQSRCPPEKEDGQIASQPASQPASPLGKLARERGITVLLEESIT